jgi:hypothetical protein
MTLFFDTFFLKSDTKMHFIKLIAIFSVLSTTVLCFIEDDGIEKHYNGYKVLRLLPNTLDQLQYLNGIASDVSFILPPKKIDFWTMPKDVNSTVDLMVAPDLIKNIQKKLSAQNIKTKVLIKDVGE